MNCNQCKESLPIPICTGILTIGTVSSPGEVYVIVKNNATGYQSMQAVTPVGGVVAIDMSLPYPDFYTPNFYYTIKVCASEDGNDVLPITINAIEYDCITAVFVAILSNDVINSIDNATIKIPV